MLHSIAQAILALASALMRSSWNQRILLLLLGMVHTLAFVPFNMVPVIFFTLPLLLIALSAAVNARQAFLSGWMFGIGHFATSLYWINNALIIPGSDFTWLFPVAWVAVPVGMGLYPALTAWLYRHMQPREKTAQVLVFAGLWAMMEYGRSVFSLIPMPWQLTGYVWADFLPMVQSASLGGIFSLSLLTLIVALLPACWHSRHGKPLAVAGVIICSWLFVWGSYRIYQGYQRPVAADAPIVRLVQPNIPQDEKWHTASARAHIATLLRLSRQAGSAPPDVIIWPESASPYYLEEYEELRRMIARQVDDVPVIIGSNRVQRHPGSLEIMQGWNSLHVVGQEGAVTATYDKHILVPFGEYVPLSSVLPLQSIAGPIRNYSRGHGAQIVSIEGLPPFTPSICYEAVFPQAARTSARAAWLVNITNDAWYGNSPGPYQHAAYARVRAVEQGLPMVRVANTGISYVVNAYGMAITEIPLNVRAARDVVLPPAIPATLYARIGDKLFFLMVACVLFGAYCAARRR